MHGDRFGMSIRKAVKASAVEKVYGGFKSLFQGDHLGVKFALESHAGALKKRGLLSPDESILQHQPSPQGPVWQCLVIDDFCCISCERDGSTSVPLSVQRLDAAERAYAEERIIGSDEKTVRGEKNFKVIGAEVLSDDRVRSAGVTTVAAPLAKRIYLATLLLRVASLAYISGALGARLAGAWTSTLMFRMESMQFAESDLFFHQSC